MTGKLPSLRSAEELRAEHLKDPEFRQRWARTALARAIALRIVAYRVKHGLSQAQLAKKLGMKQPAVARLEAGEHNPSMETMYRLSQALGIEFLVDIAPVGRQQMWVTPDAEKAEVVESLTTEDGGRILVAAS